MASKVGYIRYKRNTLLEELQDILKEYPDNEQIIKELLQNAEDAGASEIKLAFCGDVYSPLSLPEPYRSYLQGPGICFYNNSIFTEDDWEGITMVRKSIKRDNPLKIGKFGLGFKSVFHITDYVCVISGENILFIDPMKEKENYKLICPFNTLSEYGEICGAGALQPLYGIFGIDELTTTKGSYEGSLFWFPLRKAASDLSSTVYSESKVRELLQSFQQESSDILIFLKYIEKIQMYQQSPRRNVSPSVCIEIDEQYLPDIRRKRQKFNAELAKLENALSENRSILSLQGVKMEYELTIRKAVAEEDCEVYHWLIVQYFHAGDMKENMRRLIENPRQRYRPHMGVAALLNTDEETPGRLFCFLPLPSQQESPTGLPVHINGCFALDNSRQHLKWPTVTEKHVKNCVEDDALWNELMVKDVLPVVYKAFLSFLSEVCQQNNNKKFLLKRFYRTIPKDVDVKEHWKPIVPEVFFHLLNTKLPNLQDQGWIETSRAVFAVFPKDGSVGQDTIQVVSRLFRDCYGNVLPLFEFEDLFNELQRRYSSLTSTTPAALRQLMLSNERYKQCTSAEKLHLLKYACSDGKFQELDGLELIPLCNRKFGTLQTARYTGMMKMYVCNNGEEKILLDRPQQLVQMPESAEMRNILSKLACTDHYQITVMTEADLIRCLRDMIAFSFQQRGVIPFDVHGPTLNGDWLKCIWKYLEEMSPKRFDSEVRGLHIVPFTRQSNGKVCLCSLNEWLIPDTNTMSPDLKKALECLGTKFIYPGYIDHPLMFPGGQIVSPATQHGIAIRLEMVCNFDAIELFNAKCSMKGRKALNTYLCRAVSPNVPTQLQRLQLFKMRHEQSGNHEMVSILDCGRIFAAEDTFPVRFPQPLIVPETTEDRIFAVRLGGKKIDTERLILDALKVIQGEYYTDEEKRELSFYLLRNINNWTNKTADKVKTALSCVPFIRKRNGHLACARHIYDPSDDVLSELFLGEGQHIVMEDESEWRLLENLDFKTRHEVDVDDILETARKIHLCKNRSELLNLLCRKARALMRYILNNQSFATDFKSMGSGSKLSPLYNLKCVTYDTQKPNDYPSSMDWIHRDSALCSPEELQSRKHILLVGSVLPVAEKPFESLCENTTPSLFSVLEQFKIVVENFCGKEIIYYRNMIDAIYNYLNDILGDSFSVLDLLDPCILIGHEFVYGKNVYLKKKRGDLDLRPYKHPNPPEFQQYETLFRHFGCRTNQTVELLVDTLTQIKDKHSMTDDIQLEYDEDLTLICKILHRIVEHLDTVDVSAIGDLPIPVLSADEFRLEFATPGDCVYCESDWLKKTCGDDDSLKYVHPCISISDVKALGVQSLQRYMLSDSEEIYSGFGQSEPLTDILKFLLEDGYTDGFSVPKEVVQNADDAGATVVKFLYDERENMDSRVKLINPGMADCQGAALWAYNDAIFSAEDFTNIQKLSGATKKEDRTKIGKFGLGFNAVYNLTDVPSFFSGDHLVYLDPHGTYLGDAIARKETPGIKLNMKNDTMVRGLWNQFKPFDKVFDCNLLGNDRPLYQGTLFRFPLRTKEQAKKSEICDIHYSAEEMRKLLKKLCDAAGNLLLFTQSVREIQVHHIPATETNPENMHVLLHVTKQDVFKSKFGADRQDSHTSVLQLANTLTGQDDSVMKENGSAVSLTNVFLKTTLDTTRILGIPEMDLGSMWCICWALGQNEALDLSRRTACEGTLPIASVAVPVQKHEDQNIKPMYLKDAPYGFYNVSHVFCYLPLPVKIPLPIYVNGSFAVTKDRQRLMMQSEDDEEDSLKVQWNNAFISDAVLQAFLVLLEFLKDSHGYKYHSYWPLDVDEPWIRLHNAFYRSIIDQEHSLFCRDGRWMSFHECVFVHPTLVNDTEIGGKVISLMKRLCDSFVEMPDSVWYAFQLSGCSNKILGQTVSFENFYTDYFLPNIDSISDEDRDRLLLHALMSNSEVVLKELGHHNCIPTVPNGTLKKPSDLIHPHGKCARLFSEDDETFPDKIFWKYELLQVLEKLGMKSFRIEWDTLLQQTSQVVSLSKKCTSCAENRSIHILRYLHARKLEGEPCPENILECLSEIPFLPVMCKPTDWPYSWRGPTKATSTLELCSCHDKETRHSTPVPAIYEKPKVLYLEIAKNLVGCVGYVLEGQSMQWCMSELKELKVKDRDDIEVEVLGEQLLTVSRETTHTQDGSMLYLTQICHSLYEAFERRMSDGTTKPYINSKLQGAQVVLVGNKFVHPGKVVFSMKHDCSPILYSMNNSQFVCFKHFLCEIGVREQFDQSEIKAILGDMKGDCGENELPCKSPELAIRIALLLQEYDYIETDDLYLPDNDGIMRHVDELCLDDCEWIPMTNSMRVLHPGIPPELAILAKVKSKKMHDIFDGSEEFGQREELTDRIKGILDSYPEVNIIKELIQNADDAGATELHLIKDFRQHATDRVFSDEWSSLQGPALCVYNDSVFTEKDLQGIQDLGVGSKRDDPTLTGKYGVGFSAVYHLTDVPSFLSKDADDNSTDVLCVLDPHCRYIPGANLQKPGRKFQKNLKRTRENFSDVFSTYLEDKPMWRNNTGTMFRFPLRQSGANSELSSRIYTEDQIDALLSESQKEMAEYLLFLQNVRKICVSNINTDGSVLQEYVVESNVCEQSGVCARDWRRRTKGTLRTDSADKYLMERFETKYKLLININNEMNQTWLVVQSFGFCKATEEIDELCNAWREKRLGLLPRGGVAFRLKDTDKITRDDKKERTGNRMPEDGIAYCYLPLAIRTGLPVHVNGHFALDHEARNNIWWPKGSDLKKTWNKCLLEGVIAPSYASVVEYIKNETFPDNILDRPKEKLHIFDRSFPHLGNMSGEIWKELASAFYQHVFREGCKIFPVVRSMSDSNSDTLCHTRSKFSRDNTTSVQVEWVMIGTDGISPAYVDDLYIQMSKASMDYYTYTSRRPTLPSNAKELGDILKSLGMKLVDTPPWIYKSMKELDIPVQSVNPLTLLQFLRTFRMSEYQYRCRINEVDVPIEGTCMRNVGNVKRILGYCQQHPEVLKQNIDGTPLLVTADNYIRVFSTERQLPYVTRHTEVLPESKERIVHPDIVSHVLEGMKILLPDVVQSLDLKTFSKLLESNLDQTFRTGQICIRWLKKSGDGLQSYIWHFFGFLYEVYCRYLGDEIWKIKQKKMIGKEVMGMEGFRSPDTTVEERLTRSEEMTAKKLSFTVFLKDVQHYLGNYTLFPALQPLQDGQQSTMLFSLHHTKRILHNELCTNLTKCLKLPKPDISTVDPGFENKLFWNFAKQFVTSNTNACDLLNCVIHHISHIKEQNTSEEDCNSVLCHFQENLKELQENNDNSVLKSKLRKLPFYITKSNIQIGINECALVLVIPSDVPHDGLNEWERSTGVVLLKQNERLSELFLFIGCKVVDCCDLYREHLFKCFDYIPTQSIITHMTYVKDIVLPKAGYQDKKVHEYFIDSLQGLKFIPTTNGQRKYAREYCNPWEELYRYFCAAEELPPEPFSEWNWNEFMRLAGMKTEITPEQVLRFAKTLERTPNVRTKKIKDMSELLVRSMSNIPKLYAQQQFLSQISTVRFLVPMEIEDMYNNLIPQHESVNRLVSYRESTGERNFKLVWSTMPLRDTDDDWPRRSGYNGSETRSIREGLGIEEVPPSRHVVDHVRNLCGKMESDSRERLENDSHLERAFSDTMLSVYEYLSRNYSRLQPGTYDNTPVIYIKKYYALARPSRVVLDIQEKDEIPPYLYKAPVFYGQYHSLFKSLGASQCVTSNHFALVLQEIRQYTMDNDLNPKELANVKKAMQNLFQTLSTLKDKDSMKVKTLFLPNREKRLVPSSRLVFSDDSNLEKRVGDNLPLLDFFCGFKTLDIVVRDPSQYIRLLPQNYMPKILSKIVREALTRESKQTSIQSSSKAIKLQQFLNSHEFLKGILRILFDIRQRCDQEFTETEQKSIQSTLKSIRVLELGSLTTCLTHSGTKLDHTEQSATVFFESESDICDDGRNTLYVHDQNNMLFSDWIMQNTTWLAKAIDEFTRKILENGVVYLAELFMCALSPITIDSVLDNFKLCSLELSLDIQKSFVPPLGSEVPMSLHHLLDNSFTFFDKDEYIAFEVYDPMMDDPDSDEENDCPVYIVAKVSSRLHSSSNDPLETRYLIDIGNEELLEVKASQMYKFIRKSKQHGGILDTVDGAQVFSWRHDEAKKYILQIVRGCLSLPIIERRRRFKRLMLQYHPDKHVNRKDFFTELFQYLHYLIEKVERGETLDDVDISSQRAEYFRSSSFCNFMYRRGTRYGNARESYPEEGRSFFESFRSPGPQPGQAKRWFRQAKCDLDAAKNDSHDQNAYNWVCYKCHQAVEKALKAQIYNNGADRDFLNSHVLRGLVSSSGDSHLLNLVSNLESVTGSYFRMRYPDAVSHEFGSATMNIPSDLYTESDASQALCIAEEILTKIGGILRHS